MNKPIPWQYNETAQLKMWVWQTTEFELKIIAEGMQKKHYVWKITDKTRGRDIPLDSSDAVSFQEAADLAVEVIAKSYPPVLGYQMYAGDAATTFALANGVKFNFGPLVGKNHRVRFVDDDGSDKIIVGAIQVENYAIIVRQDSNNYISLPPNRIRDIQKEYDPTSLVEAQAEDTTPKSTRNKRVFYTEWRRGCTGRPGLYPGTVTHSPGDAYCSIHNV